MSDMSDLIRICVIDTIPTLRVGIVALLEPEADLAVVAITGDYGLIVSLCLEQHPNVLLLGIDTPDSRTVEIVEQLKQTCPETKILIFAAACDEACLESVLDAGADGYLLKSENPSGLAEAIRAVAQGKTLLSRPVVERLIHSKHSESTPMLTRRQMEVLHLVARGQTNSEIGQTLEISKNTVRYHLRQAFRRLDASNRTEAAMKAAEYGLLEC